MGLIGDGPAGRAFERLGSECEVVRGEPVELVDAVDAVVVGSDPELRFHHVALALEAGLDVLVEQPVAPTVENARMLERIASLRPQRPVVQLSAPDRFNPAIERLRELLAERAPVAVAIRHLGGGLLNDVLTLVSLARSPLVRLQASGGEDHCVTTLVFENGLVGTLTTGDATPAPVHDIVATAPDALIAVDAAAGSIELTRADACELTRLETSCDPLTAQAESFLEAVKTRRPAGTTLRDAIACLEVAAAVQECIAVQAAATGTGGVPAR